jgi:hypothetical protein
MKKLAFPLFLALMLLCTVNGSAQTLINGNDIASFPYTISAPGSYKLTSNITVGAYGVNAFNITASNVTLDLNGYTISGPLVCSSTSCNSTAFGNGIYGGTNLIIQNGFIKGFYGCINSNNANVQNIVVNSCIVGIQLSTGTITHNTATNCMDYGIAASNATISDNSVISNGTGIFASNSTVFNNTVNSNANLGM